MSIRIAREGTPFLGFAFGLFLFVLLLAGGAAGILAAAVPLYVAWFFRDPERIPPSDDRLVLSPADGKVIGISEVREDRHLRRPVRRVSIFMSLLDVHINRVPISGRVRQVRYDAGKFLIGFAEKASLDNEQNAIFVEGEGGREVLFVQIAGFVARRIVCYLKGGEAVRAGDRCGLIRFGSRVDVFLPLECEVLVREGQKVRGGESALGRFS